MRRRTWFGLDLQKRVVARLANHPGLIADLIGQRFMVMLDFGFEGGICGNGEPVLDAWPVGTEGIVTSLRFTSNRGWEIGVEHEIALDLPAFDQGWIHIPVDEFLRCTSPYNVAVVPKWNDLSAANDDA